MANARQTRRALCGAGAAAMLALGGCGLKVRDGVAGAQASGGSLTGAPWTVQGMSTVQVIQEPGATMTFNEEGGVGGRGFCNRYNASYETDGAALSFGPVGATRMACEPPLMDMERRFFALLAGVERYEIDADGALVLHTADGGRISARR